VMGRWGRRCKQI